MSKRTRFLVSVTLSASFIVGLTQLPVTTFIISLSVILTICVYNLLGDSNDQLY